VLFITASVLGHVSLTYVLPHYVAPEPRPPEPIDFAVMIDEPLDEPHVEPVVEEEPEPVVERIERDEVREVEEVEEVEEITEVDEELAHDAEQTEVAESDLEHSAPIAGTVNSTEGGLTVARHAGTGRDGATIGREPVRAPAAPRVGIDRRRIVRSYLREVQRALGAPRFTRALQRAEVEGVVMVGLRIDPAGHVHAVRVKQSSGHSLIDEAALAHVTQVHDVPAPPDVLDWVTREITLPVRYVRHAQR